MSFSQGWPITNAGRVALVSFATLVAPVSFRGGFMFDANGSLVYASAGGVAPDAVVGGFPFDNTGALKVNNGSGPVTTPSALHGLYFGIGVTQSLQVTDVDPVTNASNGLPVSVDGRLCVTLGGVPSGAAFDDGFDEGFA